MEGLMKLLAKSDKTAPSSDSTELDGVEAPDASSESTEGFEASASACMDALKSGDSAAFAEGLRACIEMSA